MTEVLQIHEGAKCAKCSAGSHQISPGGAFCLKQAEQLKTAVRKAAWKAGGELQGQVTTGCAWGSVCRLEKELDMFMASEFINRC